MRMSSPLSEKIKLDIQFFIEISSRYPSNTTVDKERIKSYLFGSSEGQCSRYCYAWEAEPIVSAICASTLILQKCDVFDSGCGGVS